MHATWIEIPVKDLTRALSFYQQVFQLPPTEIIKDEVRQISILANPTPEGRAGVSLNQTAHFEPSSHGTLAYFAVSGDLNDTLRVAEEAGGKIIDPKTARGNLGFFALVLDTEGNLLTLTASA